MKSQTLDSDDEVISSTVGTNTITVQYSRKMGRENYGNEECGIFLQLDADVEASAADLEAQIKGTIAFAKTIVFEQLGVPSIVSTSGIVSDTPQAAAPKTSPKPAAAKPSGAKVDKTELWAQLAEAVQNVGDDGRIEGFYDNRAKKSAGEYSKKSPDFKHIASGDGLWLDKCPEFVKLALAA